MQSKADLANGLHAKEMEMMQVCPPSANVILRPEVKPEVKHGLAPTEAKKKKSRWTESTMHTYAALN